jgi:hypothetical protein
VHRNGKQHKEGETPGSHRKNFLTTNSGLPISDNQNLPVDRDPRLLEDFVHAKKSP